MQLARPRRGYEHLDPADPWRPALDQKNAMGTGACSSIRWTWRPEPAANGDEAGNLRGERDADLDRSIREAEHAQRRLWPGC